MSITSKSDLVWAGRIGSVDFTPKQLLRLSVAHTRVRSEGPNETTWMPCIFSKNQTEKFGNKFRVGDVVELKGDLSVGEYNGKPTVTLFVRQIVEHKPKGAVNMENLYFQALKVGNHQLANLMTDTDQFRQLFWNFVQQILPGSPIPDLQQATQHNADTVVQQQAQQVVQQQAQQVVQQQAQPVVHQQAQPVVHQQAQPVVQQQVQPVVHQQQPAQVVQQQPQQIAQQQQLGQVNYANLPKELQEQISAYVNEGGAAVAEEPDFLNNPTIDVPQAIQANAHNIASEHLQNTDNFFNHQTTN